jgi:hypothetical protein
MSTALPAQRNHEPPAPAWDFYISYAREDGPAVAMPLKEELERRNFRVWIDESQMRVGDRIPSEIDRGLRSSRFAVVVFSPTYPEKRWTLYELDAIVAKEMASGVKRVLPVLHGMDEEALAELRPTLASHKTVRTDTGIAAVADALVHAVASDAAPAAEPRQAFLMHVGAPGSIDVDYTLRRRRTMAEVLKKLPPRSHEWDYFYGDAELNRAFPDRTFNGWGVPARAAFSFDRTEVGDLVLFAPTAGARGAVTHAAIVKAKCPYRCQAASRVLWPRSPDFEVYPLLFFFDAEEGVRGWGDFTRDLGIRPGWNPHGWYRKNVTEKFDRFGGPGGYLRFLRDECGFRPVEGVG